jgi:hypothetical protein
VRNKFEGVGAAASGEALLERGPKVIGAGRAERPAELVDLVGGDRTGELVLVDAFAEHVAHPPAEIMTLEDQAAVLP